MDSTAEVQGRPTAAAADRSRQDANLATLLRAGGSGRQTAVTRLYERYGHEFKRYFRRHGASDAQSQDLLQETFVKILRSIDGWSGAGTLEAWLWSVARTTMISEFRAPGGDEVSLDAQAPETAEGLINRHGAAGDPAAADCVRRGLEAFAARFPEQATLLERVAVDGWGYEELAAFRGCALGAAREFLSQCRKRLWDYIGHCVQVGAA